MRLGQLLVYFETSPAIRLLRSQNAPFVIDFLERSFKQAGRVSIPHSDLLTALAQYQEELRDSHPDRLQAKSDTYLAEWCSPDALWLRRGLEAGRDEPVYQLTPHTEDLFVFLDRALDTDLGFVGTESRLKLVIETLADLVVGSSDDPATRLAHLREEQRRLQEAIDRIETEGRVTKYQPAQIRERFGMAVSLLRQLQGDFRGVEESFRAITLQVQQRQAQGDVTRGGILKFALDAEDVLKQEDQGVSFYEFVKLILSPSQTERLERIIQDVRRIPELVPHHEGLETMRGMVTLLQTEADKVMRTNGRLSATLRRLLDARAHAERQHVARVLRDIRAHAARLSADPPREEVALDLDLDAAVESPFRRTFWAEGPQFDRVVLTDHDSDPEARTAAFERLAAMQRLDWREMRRRIKALVAQTGAPTLAHVLDVHPPDGGVIEVLGYLQIARDDGHMVNRMATQEVVVPAVRPGDLPVLVTLPLVTFTAQGKHGNAGRPS